jgi:excisionase family DNA binding protein
MIEAVVKKPTKGALVEGHFKITEAAELLGSNPRTVNEWVKQGVFPGAKKENPLAKTGSRWWIPKEDINAFLQLREAPDRFDKLRT